MSEAALPVEEIRDGEAVVAIVLRASFRDPGVHFFSQPDFSQQLGVINYPNGHVISPHVHNAVAREVMYTQETLFIRSGRCRVDLYRDDRTPLCSRVLDAGDVILLCTGGHGFEILEDCSMVEVKQGPYSGDADKTRFEVADS
jgi:mannose-6-phosphate isomerase-like protein (cupin superfamily)